MNILSGPVQAGLGRDRHRRDAADLHGSRARRSRPGSGWSTSTSSSSPSSTSSRPSRSAPRASRDRRRLRPQDARAQRVVELSEQYKLNVNPDAKIEDLPVGVRQRVEILKALYRQSDILVLDEPSAPCSRRSRRRSCSGSSAASRRPARPIIFITHKLNEVLEVADDITVLRRGRVAGTVDPKAATREHLANLMVGRDVELKVPKGPAKPGDVVLALQGPPCPRRPRPHGGRRASTSRSAPARSSPSRASRATARPSSSRPSSASRSFDSGEIDDRRPQHQRPSPAPGLRPGRRAHPRGPEPRRADRYDDRRRELHPRHLPPASRTATGIRSTARRSTSAADRR